MTALINSLGKLFGTTWDYSRSLFDWAVRTGANLLSQIFSLPQWVHTGLSYLFALVTVVLGAIEASGEFVVDMVSAALAPVASINAGTYNVGSVSASILSGINTFFPLQELFAFLTLYFVLVVTCAGIRMGKAWIPTLS